MHTIVIIRLFDCEPSLSLFHSGSSAAISAAAAVQS